MKAKRTDVYDNGVVVTEQFYRMDNSTLKPKPIIEVSRHKKEKQCNTCLEYHSNVNEIELGVNNSSFIVLMCDKCYRKLLYKMTKHYKMHK